MSMRKRSAWTDSIEREHLTEFGVHGIAVDYGHDFDTTTKAPSSPLSNPRFAPLIFTFCIVISILGDPSNDDSLTNALSAPRSVSSRACPPAGI